MAPISETTNTYDQNGHLLQAVITGANPRTVKYQTDAYGQVLVREEIPTAPPGNQAYTPRQLYYYFNGHRIGDVGNMGPSRVDYAQALAQSAAAPKTADYRDFKPIASADFDENYEPINASYPGFAATSYVVRAGDTLRTIASALGAMPRSGICWRTRMG